MHPKTPATHTTPAPGTPLYVHLPFCAAKCHYCDFFSIAVDGPHVPQVDPLVGAVLAEAERRLPPERALAPRTVFIGGGTPSLLSGAQLERLIDGLDELTGFRDSATEVTAECNPESLDRDKALRLLDLGVNRLSIGFQSLRPEILESFGRVHRVEDSFRAFEAARAAGVRNLSVDLIFAAPGQDPGEWEQDLRRVLDLAPDHLSAYNLAFEEDTLFKRWLDQGVLERQSEDAELAMFEATRAILAERGYGAYEVSNFSLPGRQCAHNVNYWLNGDYVGLGPSAVSKQGPRRFGNLKALEAYRRGAGDPAGVEAWTEELEPAARLGETWWLALRLTDGVDPALALERSGAPEALGRVAEALAERLAGGGLLENHAGRWRLTEQGLPVSDAVAREFLDLANVAARSA